MTTIVGYRDPVGSVWLGADSLMSDGSFKFPEKIEKITKIGKWWIAQAGDANLMQDLPQWLLNQMDSNPIGIAGRIMEGLKEKEYKRCDHNGPPCYHNDFILTDGIGLWMISGNGVVTEPNWDFLAAGSGDRYAYGAAFVLTNLKVPMPGRQLVQAVIEAAMVFDAQTGGEIKVILCKPAVELTMAAE